MRCINPFRAFRLVNGEVVPTARAGMKVLAELQLPCGQCMPCRINKSTDWLTRLVAESFCWRDTISACFTFSDENLPADGSVSKVLIQKALRKLRKAVAKRGGERFRYFLIAEYSPSGRPHYHLILFNYLPPDLRPDVASRAGSPQWRSDELSEAWRLGLVNFQMFTPSAAAYVAGYYVEKLTGDMARPGVAPEFMLASRGPSQTLADGTVVPGLGGIGWPFIFKFGAQIREGADYIVLDGRRVRVPAFFERKLAKSSPADSSARAELREQSALRRQSAEAAITDHLPWERAEIKSAIALAKRSRLSRGGVDGGQP